MPGVLDAYLDVLRCAHCRSPKVEAKAVQLTRGSKFCLCRACGGEFRVSAKKWTKYERRAEALSQTVRMDVSRAFPEDPAAKKRHMEKLTNWLVHLGLPPPSASPGSRTAGR